MKQKTYRQCSSMVSRKVGDELVLVPMRQNVGDLQNIFTMNEVGIRIWETIEKAHCKQNCWIKFRAYGDSMVPTIRSGDLLTVEPKQSNDLNPGDIILYRHSKRGYTAHRLVAKEKTSDFENLITRRDNQDFMDIPIFPEQVLGKVVNIECQNNQSNDNSILTFICYFFEYIFMKGFMTIHSLFRNKRSCTSSILR